MPIKTLLLEKSAEALLEKADDCFHIAATQHDIAQKQHQSASRQQDNAELQQEIADQQHEEAAYLSAKADKLVALGNELVTDAKAIKDNTQILDGARLVPKGQRVSTAH